LGASSNQLQAATNVMNAQITNVQSAESGIMDANIGNTTANLSKYTILQQTGISALQQSNQMSQSVLKLLQ
jgi:flagellin